MKRQNIPGNRLIAFGRNPVVARVRSSMFVLFAAFMFAAGGLLAVANAGEPPLPVPPIPPDEPPLASAPVPRLDLDGEFREDGRSAVTLDAGINHRPAPSMGLGYAPGANYQIDSDRRFFVWPGILVHIPLP